MLTYRRGKRKVKIIFIYITTNIINGKQYIGMHSTDNVDDGYLGSGKYILKAFKKYGKQNFTREIIAYYENHDEAFIDEKKYIKEFNTLIPSGYNLSPTGGLGLKGRHSEETKNKMRKPKPVGFGDKLSQIKKGHFVSEETKAKMSKAHKGHVPWNKGKKGVWIQSEETKKKRGESLRKTWELKRKTLPQKVEDKINKVPRIPWNKGKTNIYSEETLRKMGAKSKGRKASEEMKEKMRGNTNGRGNKGKTASIETREKISNSHKGLKHSEETKRKISNSEKLTKRKKC